jgi:hypothetical protein
MTRTWTVCRHPSPRRDGERRWDQAYQLLVRWAERGELPWPAPIAEEVPDARSGLCAGVDHPQAPAQTIEQQLDRLRAVVVEHGWTLSSPARMPSSCGPHRGPNGCVCANSATSSGSSRHLILRRSSPASKSFVQQGAHTLTPAAAGGPSHPREASQ